MKKKRGERDGETPDLENSPQPIAGAHRLAGLYDLDFQYSGPFFS